MESFVNCPNCGELIPLLLKPYDGFMSSVVEDIFSKMSIGKTENFEGCCKCKCGKTIEASLHVTCIENKG